MAGNYMSEARCRGCRRLVGVAKKDFTIYCDMECVNDFPAANTEARDALIEAMYLSSKLPLKELGDMFGFTAQNVHHIIRKRDIRKQ